MSIQSNKNNFLLVLSTRSDKKQIASQRHELKNLALAHIITRHRCRLRNELQ